ncbi:MAG TPA: VanZ family protein [Opitutaceae bacterium]|nr:VanZ family protein [Opitutaceae bacterium]
MNNSIRTWLWPILVAATIFIESGQGVVAGPDLPNFDKVAHFFVYGLLATLLLRTSTLRELGGRGVWIALALTSLFGVSDEFHQSFTPGRSVDFLDWIADTSGAALALFCYARWTFYRSTLEFTLGFPRAREEAGAANINP